MEIVKATFDGIAGKQSYACIDDGKGNQVGPAFNLFFCVLRARIWALTHGYGLLRVKNGTSA